MTFLSALYTVVISPLVLLFELIFAVADRLTGNVGLSIIFLSLAVNFLVLPLYKRADELQAEERDIQAKMAPFIKHIKKTFKGDERFFMLQEYYRINNYKPVYALKSSVSLLLQIPFFIAAYNLLSGMQSLKGMPFGFIADLGREDAAFMIGSFPVNILPILMTLINVVSGIIYTKGHPVKAKIQVYGLAAVFLFLLYHSPSGLVFYWLLNNVFSLAKNIFLKLKNPKLVLNIFFAAVGVVILVSSVIRNDLDIRQKTLIALGCILLLMPLLSGLLKNKIKTVTAAPKKDTPAFVAGTILLSLITGLLIPASIIQDSTMEFIDAALSNNPIFYVLNATCLSVGCWILWGGVFYYFMSEKNKGRFCRAIWIICGVSVMDYMLFGRNLGNISSVLQFDNEPSFSFSEFAINTAAVIAVVVVFGFVYSKLPKIIRSALIVAIMSVFVISMGNVADILGCYAGYDDSYVPSGDNVVIPLSKNGKNVVVIMLDRAMGTQIPYIFNEKPELLESYDGFTYYRNTISYGLCTNIGSPALYGGYDYTPENMNARSSESLESKHNEALKVMPVLFSENGYNITICNPTYAGYQWTPDLSIYDEYPDFNCYNVNGMFSIFDDEDNRASLEMSLRVDELRKRNLFSYSLMKISPVLLQETLYAGGSYNESLSGTENTDELSSAGVIQTIDGISIGTGYATEFIESYAVLDNLPDITIADDSANNTFFMMSNDITHSECLLQEPDYIPANRVDNTAYDTDMVTRYTIDGRTMQMTDSAQVAHYHVTMAAILKLGEWLDYLKELGVYDNTRIIIVSDHGLNLSQFNVFCNGQDMEYFMPLLLVKDFNSTGFTINEDFMTNGDTPTLATKDLIENPVNPATGHPINSDPKNGPQNVLFSKAWDTDKNNGNVFEPGSWYTFTGGDPYDPDNWTYLGDY